MTNAESYIFGLLITDGSLYLSTRNRGQVTLELNKKDEDIVQKLYTIIPNSSIRQRTRNTNFKNNYTSVCFSNTRIEFRSRLIECGFPIKNKTLLANCPTEEYNEIFFWRGVIDGDGSLGFTSNGTPFLSLVTKSENLKIKYLDFLLRTLNITKTSTRNKRDGVYNIMITNENAKKLSEILYLSDNEGLYLQRKYDLANSIQDWNKPN